MSSHLNFNIEQVKCKYFKLKYDDDGRRKKLVSVANERQKDYS